MKALRLVLRSRPAPNSGQTRAPTDPYIVKVGTLAGAVEVARQYRDAYNLSSGNWKTAEVREAATGRVVARISYSGQCWPPGRKPGTPEIDPTIDTAALLGSAL